LYHSDHTHVTVTVAEKVFAMMTKEKKAFPWHGAILMLARVKVMEMRTLINKKMIILLP